MKHLTEYVTEYINSKSKSYLTDLDGLVDFLNKNDFVEFKDFDTSDEYSLFGNLIDMECNGYVNVKDKLNNTKVYLVIPENHLYLLQYKKKDLFSGCEWDWKRAVPVVVSQDKLEILSKIESTVSK